MCSKCNNSNACGCTTSTVSFVYEGQELDCIDVPTGMSLEGVLTQINSKFCELITTVVNSNIPSYTLALNVNDLILSNDGNAVSTVDISRFLDNLNLSRIISHTIDIPAKIINLVRDDNTILPIDISSMFTVGSNTINNSLIVTGEDVKTITVNDSEGNSVQGTFTDNDTKPTGLTVTGDTTKTISLALSDGTVLPASFIDNSGGVQSRIETSSLVVDYGTFNLTTQSGTTPQGDLSLIRGDSSQVNIDVTSIVPTGLVKLDEDNIGFVLAGIDRTIKTTTLGNKAIDMTTTVVGGVTEFGAQGASSVAIGSRAFSEGDFSIAVGNSARATGGVSTALGIEAKAQGFRSLALGTGTSTGTNSVSIGSYINNIITTESTGDSAISIGYSARATGDRSIALGDSTNAQSFNETVIGVYSKDYTPQSTTDFNENDKIFVVGNGKVVGNTIVTSNAFEIFKNGACVFKPILEPTNPEEGMMYFDNTSKKMRCYDGTTWQDLF